jgi:hypothetical protein
MDCLAKQHCGHTAARTTNNRFIVRAHGLSAADYPQYPPPH